MIPLLTRDEARSLDAEAVAQLGLPSLVLMENAGAGATSVLLERFPEQAPGAVIVGGAGQNGGDAWVVARHLAIQGFTPSVVLIGSQDEIRGDARVNMRALQAMGVRVEQGAAALAPLLGGASLLVDGLFGTGLDRPVKGEAAAAIDAMNACAAPTFALDLPSGVDADTGRALGTAIQAVVTATFAGHKRGLHQHPGAALAGDVHCVGIGVPPPGDEAHAQLFEPEDVGALVEPRALDAHKGSAGHLWVVAGSSGKTGAAVLAGLGGLRGGAGLVTLAARGAAHEALERKVVELMTLRLSEGADEAAGELLALGERMGAAVIGPGLGLDEGGRSLACRLARELPVPAVIDADALTALADDDPDLRGAAGPRVLTPHPGEAARLLGSTSGRVQADRYAAAAELSDRTGAVVVLKGARTVVNGPSIGLRVCRRGTPALAAAGTGDVLAGAVGALLLHYPPPLAAIAAVVLHAMAGEHAALGDRGLAAREVAGALPEALGLCFRAAGR